MAFDLIGFDVLTLQGDPLSRAMAALRARPLTIESKSSEFPSRSNAERRNFEVVIPGRALSVARQQVRLAIADTESWRLEMVLSDIEDDVGSHIRKIEDALDDDAADAEASGETQALRQAELPLWAA
jgi:hypothetical protein